VHNFCAPPPPPSQLIYADRNKPKRFASSAPTVPATSLCIVMKEKISETVHWLRLLFRKHPYWIWLSDLAEPRMEYLQFEYLLWARRSTPNRDRDPQFWKLRNLLKAFKISISSSNVPNRVYPEQLTMPFVVTKHGTFAINYFYCLVPSQTTALQWALSQVRSMQFIP
jgi:hypothetical protein